MKPPASPEVGRFRRPNLLVRGLLAGTSFLGVGCTVAAPEATRPTRPAWEATIPPTTLPVDECAKNKQTAALQEFDDSGFFKPDDGAYSGQIIGIMDLAYPEAGPQEYANHFIANESQKLAAEDISLVFDPSVGLQSWTTEKSESGYSYSTNQKRELIGRLQGMVEVLEDYPDGVFTKLGINTIRLADTHEKKRVGGHFTPGELQLEYSIAEDGSLEGMSKETIYEVVAHEFAHALHNYLCGRFANIQKDLALANGINFIGGIPDSYNDEQVKKFYERIPKSQLAYGKERVFPDEYAATTPAEFFASVFAFTIEKRGLILPGDADFESPLYKTQNDVVDRVDEVLPGFRAFLEKQTFVLRQSTDSEIYTNAEAIEIDVADLPQIIPESAPGQQVVTNGVVLKNYFGGRDTDQVTLYPSAGKYKQADGTYNLSIMALETSPGSGLGLAVEMNKTSTMVVLQKPGEPLFKTIDQPTIEQDQGGITPRHAQWVGDPRTLGYLKQMYAEGARPVVYKFHNDNVSSP